MESIADLREKLQLPRRDVDTWYGRHVMRFFSIFLTRFFIQRKWSPNAITLLSLVSALAAGIWLGAARYGTGLFMLNLWYLLDHVDGEVARYTQKSSATGFFFDTVVNFIALPFVFYCTGLGLADLYMRGAAGWGVLAAFSSIMLMVLPACEDSVVLTLFRKKGGVPPARSSAHEAQTRSFSPKTLFSLWHKTVIFPNFLLALTAGWIVLTLFFTPAVRLFYYFWIYYAVSATVIWIAQLVQKILSRKLDASASF